MNRAQKNRGFTIVELLIVVAIVGILATIAIFAYRRYVAQARKSEVFSTSIDNQPMVPVHVLQGLREMAEDCKSLARLQLTDIPPAPRGVPQIKVTFDIDADGILSVSAEDLATSRSAEAVDAAAWRREGALWHAHSANGSP